MKEGGGAEGECERERALGVLLCHSLDIEVDPQRCCFGSRQSYFELQAVVECRALEPVGTAAVAEGGAAGTGELDFSAVVEEQLAELSEGEQAEDDERNGKQ